MDIDTKTVTTKIHTATVTLDGLKAVAIAAAKNQLGLTGDAAALVVSADATANADGSIVVEIVERGGDALATEPAAEPAPASTIPVSAPFPSFNRAA